MRTRGLGPRQAPGLHRPQQPQQARCPPCRGDSRVLLPPARNTTTRKLDRQRAALERRVRCTLAGTLPGSVVRLRARRQGNGRDRGDARRCDTRHDTHSTVAVGGGADVPDIPEVVGEQSGAVMPRRHAWHALVGVEAQDVVEGDTGVAETPRRLVGGSDGGHERVGVQASRHDGWRYCRRCTRRTTRQSFARPGRGGPSRGRRPLWDVDVIDLADRKGVPALFPRIDIRVALDKGQCGQALRLPPATAARRVHPSWNNVQDGLHRDVLWGEADRFC